MPSGPPPFTSLPAAARVLVWSVAVLAAAWVAAASLAVDRPPAATPFLVCLAVCALGSFFEVRAPGGYWLQPHLPAFVAASVLLPPWAVALVAVTTVLPGALNRRERWYRPAFNVCMFALAGVGAAVVADAIASDSAGGTQVAALLAAALTFVAVNRALV